jgi:hypothetical protein
MSDWFNDYDYELSLDFFYICIFNITYQFYSFVLKLLLNFRSQVFTVYLQETETWE